MVTVTGWGVDLRNPQSNPGTWKSWSPRLPNTWSEAIWTPKTYLKHQTSGGMTGRLGISKSGKCYTLQKFTAKKTAQIISKLKRILGSFWAPNWRTAAAKLQKCYDDTRVMMNDTNPNFMHYYGQITENSLIHTFLLFDSPRGPILNDPDIARTFLAFPFKNTLEAFRLHHNKFHGNRNGSRPPQSYVETPKK